MDCQAIETYTAPTLSGPVRLRRAIVSAVSRIRPDSSKLDLEIMSDYMKRDMGFLDGREPRQDEDLTR